MSARDAIGIMSTFSAVHYRYKKKKKVLFNQPKLLLFFYF